MESEGASDDSDFTCNTVSTSLQTPQLSIKKAQDP